MFIRAGQHHKPNQSNCPVVITCHNCCVVLTGLEGTLPLPCLHLHPSILTFLQGEGGKLLQHENTREEFR